MGKSGCAARHPNEKWNMYKRFTLRVALILWSLSRVTFAGTVTPNPVLTGTVNIVLANANGIVVLTDSNQTGKLPSGEPFTGSLPGQKLFRLDDRTVCTIAGFGAASLPGFPEFTSSAAGVLDKYTEELRRSGGTHSFREKLTTLAFLFDMQLSGIGNLQHLEQAQVGDYGFELILAGYDLDGAAKLGKLVISASLSTNGIFSPVIKQLTQTSVGRELIYETAGIGSAAVSNILTYPAQFAEEPEIERYAKSKRLDNGSSLTTDEMDALAKSLVRHSALVNSHYVNGKVWWPVGGSNQVAILRNGSVNKIEQGTLGFEPRRLNMKPFGISMGLTLSNGGRPDIILSLVQPGLIGLYLKMQFVGSVVLDNGYYFEDDFRNGTLYYSGGVLAFDRSNRITNCILKLGPHVDRKSPDVQKLLTEFSWNAVESGPGPFPFPPPADTTP